MKKFTLLAFFLSAFLFSYLLVTKPGIALTNCIVADFSLNAEEKEFVVLLNQYRVSKGLGVLTVAPSLARAATWMTNDEYVNNYFSHTDSLGRSPFKRMADCGYVGAGGENLAMGNLSTAAAVFNAWKASPGHNAAMLEPGFTQVGISHFGGHWALDFGFGNELPMETTPTVVPTPTIIPIPTVTPKPLFKYKAFLPMIKYEP